MAEFTIFPCMDTIFFNNSPEALAVFYIMLIAFAVITLICFVLLRNIKKLKAESKAQKQKIEDMIKIIRDKDETVRILRAESEMQKQKIEDMIKIIQDKDETVRILKAESEMQKQKIGNMIKIIEELKLMLKNKEDEKKSGIVDKVESSLFNIAIGKVLEVATDIITEVL